jgi:hypothetical protein
VETVEQELIAAGGYFVGKAGFAHFFHIRLLQLQLGELGTETNGRGTNEADLERSAHITYVRRAFVSI